LVLRARQKVRFRTNSTIAWYSHQVLRHRSFQWFHVTVSQKQLHAHPTRTIALHTSISQD
jgi:hypothetical protein